MAGPRRACLVDSATSDGAREVGATRQYLYTAMCRAANTLPTVPNLAGDPVHLLRCAHAVRTGKKRYCVADAYGGVASTPASFARANTS